MKKKTNIKLSLTENERKQLRKHKIKKVEILEFSPDELAELLSISENRAKEIYALADFQQVPTIGVEFAKDLIFLGYSQLAELADKDGALLLNDFEKKQGFQTDPCVEDQFRLVVDFAKHKNYSKKWWDFTEERKAFRAEFGYPKDRPTT